jgi:hypothetical protein
MRREESMKKIKLIASLIVVILLAASSVHAQQPFQASAYFSLGFPQSEFRNNVDRIGYSGVGHFAYNFRNSPFLVGVSLGILVYGRETRTEPLSLMVPDVMVNVTTTNNIFLCHFLLRVQPQKGMIRPYLEGLIGFNYLYPDTGVKGRSDIGYETIASSNIHNDLALSYGAGSGLMIQLFSKQRRKKSGSFAMYLDMAVRFFKGGRAEYLIEDSIRLEDDRVVYDVYRSATDLVTGYIGVSFSF